MFDNVLVEPLIEVPASVVIVPPRLTAVLPIVIDELVRLPLAILVSVFDEPLMVLFVSVCAPDSVATVASMAIVTFDAPLYEVPLNPVPIVSVPVDVAVTVTVPPKDTVDPLIVIALFVNPALGIVATAVNALVPFPTKYPVSEVAPVPPFAGINVPLRTMTPDCAELGRRPVVPPLKVVTPPDVVNVLHAPEEYPSKV